MMTLVCALVGVKASAFVVDIEGSKLVAHLKDAIKAKKPNRIHCDADELQLFLAQKDGAWLDEDSADAVTLEELPSFEQMKASLRIDNAKYFGGKFKLNEGDIHVLVKVPPDAVGSASEVSAMTAPLTIDQVKMAVDSVLDERERKRSEYSISTCPRSKETLLRRHLGLEYYLVEVTEVEDDSIEGYQWTDLTEKHPDQRMAYAQYIEAHLRNALFVGQRQQHFLEDVASLRTLLDCDDRNRLPFKVKGTADMIVIDAQAKRAQERFAGLRFVIEVKKRLPTDDDRWQLLLELTVADLKSERRCAPVGLLTDLNNYWYFLWFTEKHIARMVLTCPANAFKMMEEILKIKAGPSFGDAHVVRAPFLESPVPLKMRKLVDTVPVKDDDAAEMLERYELMSDELGPEFLRERRLDYAFHLVSQMPIHSAMYS